jgi:prepilin-type N-terminal cleavage/methylation domain-containing protein
MRIASDDSDQTLETACRYLMMNADPPWLGGSSASCHRVGSDTRGHAVTPTSFSALTSGRKRRAAAFTLVEILIVVVILAILAAIVVPQFSSATNESRDSSLRMSLYRVRQQLEIYKQQHNGNWPDLGADGAAFTAQMTQASNVNGDTAVPGTAGYPFGPYIREVPPNPWTSTTSISNGAVGSSAWYYDPDTGLFRANDHAGHTDF